MSLSDRRGFLISLTAFGVAACGFEPVYRTGGAARGLNGQIRMDVIQGRDGFDLLRRIESRLGKPVSNPRFALAVEFVVTEDSLVLDAAKGISRFTLNGVAHITVKSMAEGTKVFAAKLRETTAYSGTSETGQTDAAKRDAHSRLATAMADQIVTRLTSTAESWAK